MAELFTRGAQNAPRGDALMQRHANKLQFAKEQAALKAIRQLQPDVSPSIWAIALDECDWDVESSNSLMNSFKAAKAHDLATIQRALEALKGGRGDSESDNDSQQPSRKRKSKDRKKEKSVKRSKKEKKEKKDRSSHKRARSSGREPATMKEQFGKYGIIGEKDLERKYTEFALWALEVQQRDIENLPKLEERELFRTYCEDYNTATLPHSKYHDMAEYERRRREDKAAHRDSDDDEPMMLNDEAELKRQQAAERALERQERLRDAYLELKHRAPGKAAHMREQDLLRSQMALAYRTGDREKAAQIQERLKPDEVKEREAAKRMDPDNPGAP